jgi:hypothetical protein
MLNNYRKAALLISIIFLSSGNLFSQIQYGDYDQFSVFDMDYVQDGDIVNYRVRKKGDKAIGLYYFVPFDLSLINEDIINDSNTITYNEHRVTEKLIPNMKYYLSDKSNLVFGIYYKRSRVKYDGEIDTSITPSNIIGEKETFSQTGFYGRVGYEHHWTQPTYRKFDIDIYSGIAGSFGFSPSKSVSRTEFDNGDYSETTLNTRGMGLGIDLYTGVNFQFDNFSVGFELIALGFDSNRSLGKSKVTTESSTGGAIETNEYFTYDENPEYAYTKLNLSRNLTSMYRGLRLSLCYYF